MRQQHSFFFFQITWIIARVEMFNEIFNVLD